MAENDFLLVVPEGWIEMANFPACIVQHMQPEQLQDLVGNQEWIPVSQLLEDRGEIEPNTQISDARIIKTGLDADSWKFWYKL